MRVGGRARAYLEQILIWHEIVNDTLGGRPLGVTYCPLWNSALAFDRRIRGRTLTFGTTGKLRVVGRYTGSRLRPIEAQVLSWLDFESAYPRGTVLSRHTGFDRPYGMDPYVGYDTAPRPGRASTPAASIRGCRRSSASSPCSPATGRSSSPFSTLARRPVVAGAIGGRPLVVLYARGTVSALDEDLIAQSREVGSAGVFDPRVGRRTLRFTVTFRDQTGSTWDLSGRALRGPLRGERLRALPHDEQVWFALAAFLPHAEL